MEIVNFPRVKVKVEKLDPRTFHELYNKIRCSARIILGKLELSHIILPKVFYNVESGIFYTLIKKYSKFDHG